MPVFWLFTFPALLINRDKKTVNRTRYPESHPKGFVCSFSFHVRMDKNPVFTLVFRFINTPPVDFLWKAYYRRVFWNFSGKRIRIPKKPL